MTPYGKHCVCGHGISKHRCIKTWRNDYLSITQTWRSDHEKFDHDCAFGCKAVIKITMKKGHTHKICGCKEYKLKEENDS